MSTQPIDVTYTGAPRDESDDPVDLENPVELEIRRSIREGRHRDALSECAQHYGDAIGRLCMAMVGNQGDAEELAQETLLTGYAGFGEYRGEGMVRAWFLGIARIKCLKHLQRRRLHDAKLVLLQGGQDSGSAEDLVERRERAERARWALAQVRPTEREALLLRYQAELSFADVASACDVEPSAARKRVSRGLARLRQLLLQQEKV